MPGKGSDSGMLGLPISGARASSSVSLLYAGRSSSVEVAVALAIAAFAIEQRA